MDSSGDGGGLNVLMGTGVTLSSLVSCCFFFFGRRRNQIGKMQRLIASEHGLVMLLYADLKADLS